MLGTEDRRDALPFAFPVSFLRSLPPKVLEGNVLGRGSSRGGAEAPEKSSRVMSGISFFFLPLSFFLCPLFSTADRRSECSSPFCATIASGTHCPLVGDRSPLEEERSFFSRWRKFLFFLSLFFLIRLALCAWSAGSLCSFSGPRWQRRLGFCSPALFFFFSIFSSNYLGLLAVTFWRASHAGRYRRLFSPIPPKQTARRKEASPFPFGRFISRLMRIHVPCFPYLSQ